jgi:small subunit ribosomal protein S2
MNTATETPKESIDRMFTAGAHYGVPKARRHPTSSAFVFGQKQKIDIFDLEKTDAMLELAKDFVRTLGQKRKTLLFVGGKPESQRYVKNESLRIGAPYCVGRWIGGTITNFSEIRKRIARLEKLTADRTSGALSKYTKLERLLIDREIEKLETMYAGLTVLGDKIPDALFIVDPKREMIAVREAKTKNLPVIALANSDCDLTLVNYPIPANDATSKSISYFVNEIATAYEEGLATKLIIEESSPVPAKTA